VAARGENDQQGCEYSYLVEHLGLSPGLFLIISDVSSHSSSSNLIKFAVFSCFYWYMENMLFSLINLKPKPKP